MKLRHRKLHAALSVVVLALMLTVMACTANDTWIIRLTTTPTPTITPTPLSGTRYAIGDKLSIIGSSAFAAIGLNLTAGPFAAVSSATQCLPQTSVTILDVSRNISDSQDEMMYYLVSCSGKQGWIPEYQISNRLKGTKLIIKSEDGSGAAIYSQNDAVRGKPLENKCPDGTEITVADTVTGKQAGDKGIYFQTTCDKLRGYVLEKDVISAE